MKDITPDICDQFEDQVTLLDLPLQNFGQRCAFWGEIITVRCYHDNSKVREVLQQNGQGKVLIIDGHGSCHKALLGDQLAMLAVNNGWEGIIVYGAVRDVAQISQMDIGIQAMGSCPFKTQKRGMGEVNISLTMHNQIVQPKHYVYADWNGVLIAKQALKVTLSS
ncbi:ribonuclease activity regulator protein RraA [Vibrio azureus]|uniref:4-hydroxy-4-methyl-2-oxoglutarate aldolase n=1 Tax=Vibrio azureus NBRC 104587 TaxID=1219077 RepID=U3AQY7_9VIBR|nr:putative 4-hydroxy-4-methyl-2-oxoglutarate aldolase [Vibrio azureus]AUI85312.1 ribonuclease activity regulator protein RraA [Vibrio azureus]GAD76170.1 ribonuclease regulator RraA [Vibrio azureus NBRC 104587]